jgi:hypothetical protein
MYLAQSLNFVIASCYVTLRVSTDRKVPKLLPPKQGFTQAKLFLVEAVVVYWCVSCEVRTSLHIKSKAVHVTDRGGLRGFEM